MLPIRISLSEAPGSYFFWAAAGVAATVDARLAVVEEDVDTLGGLAVILAGHVPQQGEIVEHPSGWRLESVAADERKMTRLRLHAPEPAEVG